MIDDFKLGSEEGRIEMDHKFSGRKESRIVE